MNHIVRSIAFSLALLTTFRSTTRWSQMLSGILYKTGRAMSVGLPISAGGYISFLTAKAYSSMEKMHEERQQEVPRHIDAWCREQLRPCGEEFLKKVLIKEEPSLLFAPSPAAASANILGLHPSVIKSMSTLNNIQDLPSVGSLPPPLGNNLSSLPFILRHEAAHICLGDSQLNTRLISLGMSIALPQLVASGIRFLRKVKPPTTTGRALVALGGASWVHAPKCAVLYYCF